jgi:asparagine synthase (glutamine-hydrolysing)
MCGICGIIHLDGRPVDRLTVETMNRTMTHRGPDEEGFYVNTEKGNHGTWRFGEGKGDVGIGHRRLSIIDLSTGQQPLCNEDASVWISFNGEVYNFLELKKELENKGHRFRTNSDTEAIVHAYEEWGVKAVERFRGMFSFAIWDQKRDQLYIARDRLGKKPLYYLSGRNRFAFASEIKALLELPDVDRALDMTALSDYLSLLYVPSPKTIFKSIRKLPAAHYAVVTRTGIQITPYWDLPFYPRHDRTEKMMMAEMLEILADATKMRMISDVPLGAFLSGGVDSSAVVALMAEASEEPVVTNAISFSVSQYNEARYARQVADQFKTNHHEFMVTPEAIPIIEKLAWHYDEPFADSSAVPTYYVSKTARESVTVSLSGDGGDENFAGYRRYYMDMRENLVRNLVPPVLRKPVFETIGKLYPKADYLPQIFRGKAFLSNVARDPIDAYFFSVGVFYDPDKAKIFNGDVNRDLAGYRTFDLFKSIYDTAPADDHLSKIQYLDIKTYLCDDILTKVDRASMAVSLEVRCPVLDHVFMEYVAGIPSKLKLVGTDGKHIFKKALKKYLPDDILYRKKMGFGVPIMEWLRGELKEYARKWVLEGSGSRQFFNMDYLDKIWKEHQRGVRNWATELWIVMMFNLWFKNWGETSR